MSAEETDITSNELKGETSEKDESAKAAEKTEENDLVPAKISKVEVLLKAAGDAPIMKKKKWALEPSKKIGFIIDFIKKLIKCDPQESLFIYVNQSFAPSPDVEVGTLYECFGADGKLILHYCKSQAWG